MACVSFGTIKINGMWVCQDCGALIESFTGHKCDPDQPIDHAAIKHSQTGGPYTEMRRDILKAALAEVYKTDFLHTKPLQEDADQPGGIETGRENVTTLFRYESNERDELIELDVTSLGSAYFKFKSQSKQTVISLPNDRLLDLAAACHAAFGPVTEFPPEPMADRRTEKLVDNGSRRRSSDDPAKSPGLTREQLREDFGIPPSASDVAGTFPAGMHVRRRGSDFGHAHMIDNGMRRRSGEVSTLSNRSPIEGVSAVGGTGGFPVGSKQKLIDELEVEIALLNIGSAAKIEDNILRPIFLKICLLRRAIAGL